MTTLLLTAGPQPLLLPARCPARIALDVVVCADALDFLRRLPDACVDAVITSPPYNLGRSNTRGSGIMKKSGWSAAFSDGYATYNDDIPEPEYQNWLKNVVSECLRISRGLVWINHKMRYRDGVGIHPLSFLPFPLWSEVIWARNGSFMLNSRRFANSHEYLLGFGRPHFWNDNFNKLCSVWNIAAISTPDHPAPFPETLIQPLVESSCPADGTVCDPFMGSGTTARVCKRLGRHYIGCDISAEYVALAQKRLSQPYTLPLPLMI